ncbi:MAG: alpha/beta fold hydrolase [Chitinophagales bacterium]
MKYNWLNKSEYPFNSNYFNGNGYGLHYIDEGQGDIILFVHGTPSWSFDYRNVIKQLSGKFRCIAIDHIGFGLSDKPEHYDYSTQNHSAVLEKFVLQKDLRNITLVVHDFGGPIGLNVAINQPERIKNLVILNSWLWSSETDPDYIKLRRVLKSPLLPFLYRYLNFSARFVLPSSFGAQKLSGKLLKQYTAPFGNSTERNGTLAFAKSMLNDQPWFERLWQRKEAISAKPALFIWGMADPVISPKYLDRFISGFANSTFLKLDGCGHFPQEERSAETAEAIGRFLQNK